MTHVWQMTRDKFVGDWPVYDDEGRDLDMTLGYECAALTRDWIAGSRRPVPGCPGFFFADIDRQPCDVALLQKDALDGSFAVVGYYCGGHLRTDDDAGQIWVDPAVRGRGLAVALILEKADQVGGAIHAHSYTPAGRAAHEAAHATAVRRALRDGFRVPGDVLADYPNLAAIVPRSRREPTAASPARAMA